MENSQYVYYGLIAVAAFCAPFNRQAAVIVLAWAFVQWGPGVLGVDLARATDAETMAAMSWWDAVANAIGLVLAYAFATSRQADILVWVLFIPMVVLNLATATFAVDALHAYWIGYALAVVQIMALPAGSDWGRALKTWRCYAGGATRDWFMRLVARRHAA